ncbi:hypothetical protein BsWGS_18014 [Bradybaena similaris]
MYRKHPTKHQLWLSAPEFCHVEKTPHKAPIVAVCTRILPCTENTPQSTNCGCLHQNSAVYRKHPTKHRLWLSALEFCRVEKTPHKAPIVAVSTRILPCRENTPQSTNCGCLHQNSAM